MIGLYNTVKRDYFVNLVHARHIQGVDDLIPHYRSEVSKSSVSCFM